MGVRLLHKNRLTTKDTWQAHWESKKHLRYITHNYSFHEVIYALSKKLPPASRCIELGGYPGYFSIYFKKYCGLSPTLIDYYFDHDSFKEIIEFNGLQVSDISIIQDDVISHAPNEFFDLVASFGLIEHFRDLNSILSAHIKFLKPGGILLISLPNFMGINGLLQKYFDPTNLSIHNLEVMNLELLKISLVEMGLTQVDASYYPSTQVWIENLAQRGFMLKVFVRAVGKLAALASLFLGKKNKLLSNSIIVTARAPSLSE